MSVDRLHVDSSFVIDLLRERTAKGSRPATRRLEELADVTLVASVFVACELEAGTLLARDARAERRRIDALLHTIGVQYPDERLPPTYARLYAELYRRGQRIPAVDLFIASMAVADNVPLLTRNVRDFERVPGLTVMSY
ncbi:MAG: type II toxin-antitoxin system VapC family toxin [Gemmatimonadaceae bacterium]|jgi:tRNA(fMet)-specific endonuclease VapC|nr:type II toxin-antitoxin system VapC family toxin [Gemmatimonadaceae bacterium]